MRVEVEERQEVYRGFFRLERWVLRYQRFAGDWSRTMAFENLERGEAAAVLLYDPARDCVGLVRQFRIGAYAADGEGWTTELVAGACNGEGDPAGVAQREVQEEAGVELTELRFIMRYFLAPGGSSERIHLFLGLYDSTRAPNGGGGLAHEGEDIELITLPYDEAWRLIEEGVINSATAILAFQWLRWQRSGRPA